VPEYNVEKAKQLLAQQGFPMASSSSGTWPFPVLRHGRAHPDRSSRDRKSAASCRCWRDRPSGQSRPGPQGISGSRTIVQNIDPRSGGAQANIGVYAVCGSSASFICEPQIEALWTKHQASVDPANGSAW